MTRQVFSMMKIIRHKTRITLDEQIETAIKGVLCALRDLYKIDSSAEEIAALYIDSGVCLLTVNVKTLKAVDGILKDKWNSFMDNK